MIYEKARPNRLAFFFAYVTGIVTTRFPAPGKEWIMGNAKSHLFRGVACGQFRAASLFPGNRVPVAGGLNAFSSIGYQRISDRG